MPRRQWHSSPLRVMRRYWRRRGYSRGPGVFRSMQAMRATPDRTDPWHAIVNVTQIPESGLHREIEAGPAIRAAMAEIAGLREISSARAWFDMNLRSGGRVHVAGSVKARIGQTCVVTLDPVENDIDEEVDLMFAPEEQISYATDDLVEDADGGERK